jgi:sugar lactone lactonase YvrE
MTNFRAITGVCVTVAVMTYGAFGQETSAPGAHLIRFSADTLFPESVAWSAAQNRFFVSSIRHGTVGTVTRDGVYVTLVKDDGLRSSIGLQIDDRRNMLWVTSTDLGDASAGQGYTGVAAYDALTGKRLGLYNLQRFAEGRHLANDLALDGNGNAYVTDSYAPLIYRIDTKGNASIFARNPMFQSGEGYGLNGIAYHPDGFLLVGKHNSGDIFRVSLSDPDNVLRVNLAEAVKGIDGMTLVDGATMVAAVTLGANHAVEIISDDGWKSAHIGRTVDSLMSMPTDAVVANDELWMLNSRIDAMSGDRPVSEFSLQPF